MKIMSDQEKRLHIPFNRSLFLSMDQINIEWYASSEIQESLYTIWKETLDDASIREIPENVAWKIIHQGTSSQSGITTVDETTRMIVHRTPHELTIVEANSLTREALTKLSLRRGTVWLHGSAFKKNGTVFVVLGPKGFGKTTWLAAALFKCNAEFLGNDQVPFDIANSKLVTRLWRPDVKIAVETLDLLQIEKPNTLIAEKYLWLPSVEGLKAIDTEALSLIRGENIKPFYPDVGINLAQPRRQEVNIIIFLRDDGPLVPTLCSRTQNKLLLEFLSSDPENLFPKYLPDWQVHVQFWRRITDFGLIEGALDTQEAIMDHILGVSTVYHANNRMPVADIMAFLENT